MKDFERRLIEEESSLSFKIEGLSKFMDISKFNDLSKLQKLLLEKQLGYMINYLAVLRTRMIVLGISSSID